MRDGEREKKRELKAKRRERERGVSIFIKLLWDLFFSTRVYSNVRLFLIS